MRLYLLHLPIAGFVLVALSCSLPLRAAAQTPGIPAGFPKHVGPGGGESAGVPVVPGFHCSYRGQRRGALDSKWRGVQGRWVEESQGRRRLTVPVLTLGCERVWRTQHQLPA